MQLSSVFAILAFTAGSVLASPPGCLLSALNSQANPADLKAVCGKASDVQKSISSACSGGDVSLAQSAFAQTCKDAGVTVPTVSAAASNSGTSNSDSNSDQQPMSGSSSSEPPNPSSSDTPRDSSSKPSVPSENPGQASSSAASSSSPKPSSSSSSSSSTNLLNSGSNTTSSNSSSGNSASSSAKANAGAQLAGWGIGGMVGVAAAFIL